MYTCGKGEYGRLMLGDDLRDHRAMTLAAPAVAVAADSIERVACGGSHTALLTTSGRVYTCGREDGGRLGATEVDSDGKGGGPGVPRWVESLSLSNTSSRVTQVACGGQFCAAVMAP